MKIILSAGAGSKRRETWRLRENTDYCGVRRRTRSLSSDFFRLLKKPIGIRCIHARSTSWKKRKICKIYYYLVYCVTLWYNCGSQGPPLVQKSSKMIDRESFVYTSWIIWLRDGEERERERKKNVYVHAISVEYWCRQRVYAARSIISEARRR